MKDNLKSLLTLCILYLVFASLITFPLVLHLKELIIGMLDHPGLQGQLFFQYNIFYNAKEGNLFHWFITDLLNYPEGQNLGFTVGNSLHLFFSLPLQIFFDLITSYNISVLLTLVLNGLAMYCLAKYFFASKSIAFASGLFFMINAYTLLKLSQGFLQKVTIFWIPLYFLYLFRLRKENKLRYIFLSGLLLFLTQWTYAPYAYYAILFTIFLVIYDLIETKGSLHFVRNSFLMFSSFLLVTFNFWYGRPDKILSEPMFLDNLKVISSNGCLDIFQLFRFYPYHSQPYPTHLPLGVSIIATAITMFAIFKKSGFPRFLFIAAFICLVVSMGPYLSFNGSPLELNGHKIMLPYYFLSKYFPFGWRLIFPIRIFPLLNICLGLLIGFGLTLFKERFPRMPSVLVASLFIVIYILESLVVFPELFPPILSTPRIPEFYKKIKDEKFEAILNLPLRADRKAVNLYCYYAAMSGKKSMNPYDRDELSIVFPESTDARNIKKQFIKQLSRWKVRYIVIHRKLFKDETTLVDFLKDIAWIVSFCGTPKDYDKDGIIAYRVPTCEELEIL